MDEIQVPPFFLCPISLEIMRDPVIISTGITYDRDSIETWLFSSKNKFCPVTKLPVTTDSEDDLITPNHTLRRLIQSWCTLNASKGVERIPTPKPPVSRPYVQKLLSDAHSPGLQTQCLKRLRSIATSRNGSAKRCVESAGAVQFLASLVNSEYSTSTPFEEARDDLDVRALIDDAMCILYNLQLTDSGFRKLIGGGQFVDSLINVMQRASYDSRAYAVFLLKSMFEVAEPMEMITLRLDFFHEIVQVLHDGISPQATKAALKLLIHVCPWGRNRVKAVEAGEVKVLVEMLLESSEKRICELALMLLEMACQCAEGRAELLRHSAGLAVVSKKILRVSQMANEQAVRILLSLVRFSATSDIVQDMLEIGVVAKLCLVLQKDSGKKTKEKATEILRLHGRSWRNSPCIPANLASSYPSLPR